MRRRRTYNRQQQAVRWLVRLTIVVVFLVVTGFYDFLPSQSMESQMQKEGLENVQTVYTEWGKYSPMDRHLLQVSENEDVVALTASKFDPFLGWYSLGTAHVLQRTAEPNQHYSSWTATRHEDKEEWICIFGYVPDGGEVPTFRVGICDWTIENEEIWNYVDGYLEFIPEPTIPVKGGMCYLEQYYFDLKDYDPNFFTVEALVQENGEWVEPSNRCGTFFS